MPIFKSKKSKDGSLDVQNDLNDLPPVKQLDKRLGLDCYRDFFTLKNYWKTVTRRNKEAEALLMHRFLKTNPELKKRYPKLASVSVDSAECSDPAFEAIASQYLKIFDEVISIVEANPGDASDACQTLTKVGKIHKTRVAGMKRDDFKALEPAFIYMVGEVLQDRFNDKAESLFRKFFQFCLNFILEGFDLSR